MDVDAGSKRNEKLGRYRFDYSMGCALKHSKSSHKDIHTGTDLTGYFFCASALFRSVSYES